MHMPRTTTSAINHTLSAISQNGLSGVTIQATSLTEALTILLKDDMWFMPSQIKTVAQELRRQQLIELQISDDYIKIQPSVKGIHRLQQWEITKLTIPYQPNWDKKWRIVMFDIPARKAESRYVLTSQLKRLGFRIVQSSIWAHPYPCFEVIEKIIVFANLQGYVTLAEVSRLDSSTERHLRRYFGELK